MNDAFPIWTVYDGPADYPGQYVARLFVIRRGVPYVTDTALFSVTLDGLRAKLPPGLFCMPRLPEDEPHIVESWL